MLDFSRYCLTATTVLVGVALILYLVALTVKARPAKKASTAESDTTVEAADKTQSATSHGMGWLADLLAMLALATATVGLICRMIAVGHAPFSNQYEYAYSFAWGILLVLVAFLVKFGERVLALLALPIAFGMLAYCGSMSAEAAPLVPALQNNWLLPAHVFAAVVGYGAAAVGAAAAILYLLADKIHLRAMPTKEFLDELGYKAIVIAFPCITVMLVLGAVWADIAWGRYWSWDPKETAALVTWLIYGAYLHARVVRGWRGTKAAWLLVLGFVAVMFTFLGNAFFGGLHSYGK
ncbi:MAG: c-type cytochrome biogenesis protein CcsB [Propionibacteriaceae bacterium]